MKVLHSVSVREVKRAFVVSELAKKLPLATAIRTGLRMTDRELDAIVGHYPRRLGAYDACDWYLAEFDTTEIGVWSRAGDLPSRWTRGSLAETGRLCARALRLGTFKRLAMGRSARVIPSMIKDTSRFQSEKYLLPVAFKSATGTRGRYRLKQLMKADLDDGSKRSVAMAVKGAASLRVYYGVPRAQ